MSRIVLFSDLTEANKSTILNILFPQNSQAKLFAYMPSGGIRGAEDYILQWKSIANEYGVNFCTIDNTSVNPQEGNKLLTADIVMISGGNTFQLLSNLRKSGLDKLIKALSHEHDVTIAGCSAGALVLTPTIEICNLFSSDENFVKLENLQGLGVVDFELFPHFEKTSHESILNTYRESAKNKVRAMSDEEYISVII